MKRYSALIILSAVLLASCSQEYEVNEHGLSHGGLWRAQIDRDLPKGTPLATVENYLSSNGASELTYSNDRRTLLAAQSIRVKRLFPPIDLKSVRIKCEFDESSELQACSVVISTQTCCGS